jgi:cellobiose-specific phosphotransferase system component IIC
MSRSLLPWLVPVALVVVLIAGTISVLLAVALAVVVGVVCLPFVYRAYQDNRANQVGGGPKPPRRDPPNNRSLLR